MTVYVLGGFLVATGTNATGVAVDSINALLDDVEINATTPINVAASTTVQVSGCAFDPTAVVNAGTLEYLAGDRAVYDALGYQARHANDIDAATGIHHTAGGMAADENMILASQIFGG